MLPRAGQQSSGPSQGLPSNSMAPMHFIKSGEGDGLCSCTLFSATNCDGAPSGASRGAEA